MRNKVYILLSQDVDKPYNVKPVPFATEELAWQRIEKNYYNLISLGYLIRDVKIGWNGVNIKYINNRNTLCERKYSIHSRTIVQWKTI